MEEARKNLGRAIKEDRDYLLEVMGERDVLETPSFTAKMKTRTQTRLMGLEHIRNLLGTDTVNKNHEDVHIPVAINQRNFCTTSNRFKWKTLNWFRFGQRLHT